MLLKLSYWSTQWSSTSASPSPSAISYQSFVARNFVSLGRLLIFMCTNKKKGEIIISFDEYFVFGHSQFFILIKRNSQVSSYDKRTVSITATAFINMQINWFCYHKHSIQIYPEIT